jgi:hypothetical protein
MPNIPYSRTFRHPAHIPTMTGITNFGNFASFASRFAPAAKLYAPQSASIALPKVASEQPSPSAAWSTKDEFLPTPPVSLATFKRPAAFKSAPTPIPAPVAETPKTEEVANPIAEATATKNLDSLLLAITQILEDNGITLADDDVLTVTIDKAGKFSVELDESSIGGAAGEEISELCSTLIDQLNEAKFGEDMTLGEALLKQVTQDLELGESAAGKHFSRSFFVGFINAETGQNKIINVNLKMPELLEALPEQSADNVVDEADEVEKGLIPDDTLAQQYSILVTDKDGNRLANDQIIVAARNGNQVEMSVEQFAKMSRLEITKLLR